MLKALTAFLLAAAAYLNRWHLWKLADIERDLKQINDEIDSLSSNITPANLLRIDRLRQDHKRIGALLSAMRDAGERD